MQTNLITKFKFKTSHDCTTVNGKRLVDYCHDLLPVSVSCNSYPVDPKQITWYKQAKYSTKKINSGQTKPFGLCSDLSRVVGEIYLYVGSGRRHLDQNG